MKNFQIRKILIPVDFSDTSLMALEHGWHMASLYNAQITLLHVIKPNLVYFSQEHMPLPLDIMKYQEENAQLQLDKLKQQARTEYRLELETICQTGFVCSTIVSMADSLEADLIIMGTHGTSGFTERFIGSNAYKVVNDANCPVLTIQAHAEHKGFKDIVLPIDHSFYSRQKVVHAAEIAAHYGSRIHILGLSHVKDRAELNKLNMKLEQTIDYLRIRNIPYDKQIKLGLNYAKVTMEYAEAIKADLIMIMTEWEEDLTGIFIGPFARQIVNHSKIPVMSIRPEVRSDLVESGMLWMEQPG